MEQSQLIEALKTYITEEILEGQETGLTETTPLLEWGILDSVSMVSLLSFVEEKFGIRVPDDEVRPENFQDLNCLAKLFLDLASKKINTKAQVKEEPQSPLQPNTAPTTLMVRVLASYGAVPDLVELPFSDQHILRTSGQSPLWLFVPALGNPSTSWGDVLRAISGEVESISIDLVGFGMSGWNKTEVPTYFEHLEETLSLVEKVGKPPMIIFASSLNSVLAAEIVRRHPEWFKAFVVVGFGLVEDPKGWWDNLMSLSKDHNQYLQSTYFQPPTLTAPLKLLLTDALSRPTYANYANEEFFKIVPKAFDNISVPTLFVGGEDDSLISYSQIEAASDKIKNSQIKMIPRCGHFPFVERPQEFLALTKTFINALK